LTPLQHFRALTNKLAKETTVTAQTPKGKALLEKLKAKITAILDPPTICHDEQRVRDAQKEQQQRVIDDSPIITIPRISNAPPIMNSRDPTA
jgi:hypothetical protein